MSIKIESFSNMRAMSSMSALWKEVFSGKKKHFSLFGAEVSAHGPTGARGG